MRNVATVESAPRWLWASAVVKRGRILFELEGVPHQLAQEAFRLAAYKIPFRTRFIARETAK